ncbi:hypothetical protein PM082_023211 [Marasmius tenuissimus]|nr:hypothetical protein PM082_023211 [Marasmius tenuissimus]
MGLKFQGDDPDAVQVMEMKLAMETEAILKGSELDRTLVIGCAIQRNRNNGRRAIDGRGLVEPVR